MKKDNTQTLKEAITDLLKAYRLDGKINELNLISSWEKITGKVTANRTKDIYIKDKSLFVHIDSAALKHELSMNKSKIISELNKEAGSEVITELVIR